MSDKKNPDYSQSAVNLVNPPELKELVEEWKGSQKYLASLNEKAKALIPTELQAELNN